MNRITALLLAMAALLVHVLVVHRSAAGGFAPPFESAHAALHLGRVLAREGVLAGSVDPASGAVAGGLWSYPSPLLVGVAAAAERVYVWSTFAAQLVGIACVLLTVFLSTRFDTDRIAGVVPALLLVSSGAVAVAGASGTEWPIAMFLLATAFVALEHGRSRFAALALALLVVARPEGSGAAAVLAIQTALRRRSARGASSAVPGLVVFAPALATLALAHGLGASLVEDLSRILRPDGAAARHGLAQLRDFAVTTVSPFLLVFPLIAIAIGELTPVGRRALVLAAACWTASVLAGGGPAAFDLAFTMALPSVFIAIQQGIARALDTYRASMERLSWLAIGVAILGSLLASRFPGDLGRFGLREVQERARTAAATQPPGHGPILGRSAHFAEWEITRVGLTHVVLARDVRIASPDPREQLDPGVVERSSERERRVFGVEQRHSGEPRGELIEQQVDARIGHRVQREVLGQLRLGAQLPEAVDEFSEFCWWRNLDVDHRLDRLRDAVLHGVVHAASVEEVRGRRG